MEEFKKEVKKHLDMGKLYGLNTTTKNKFFLIDFNSGVALGALIRFLQQDNNFEQFKKLVHEN